MKAPRGHSRKIPSSRCVVLGICIVLLSVAGAPAVADSAPQAPTPAQATPEPKPSPEPTPEPPAPKTPAPTAVNYFFPDLGRNALVVDGKHVWFKPIFAIVGDSTWFTQDDASVAQSGKQEDKYEWRALRLGATIRLKGGLLNGWELYSTVDYQERRTRKNVTFMLYDLQLRIPLGPVKVTIGKMKEPFSYELAVLSVVAPQQERILLPFFPTRNIGVLFSGQLAGGRMTWAAGAFNDWLETGKTFSENASVFTGRVTALAWDPSDKSKYLHLALGERISGSDEGTMVFAGKPESNVASKYVNTGKFPAIRSNALSLEGLLSLGRFSVLAEHIGAWVDAPQSGDPYFYGYYVLGSWILTGESRPYIRSQGTAGIIVPKRRFGAVELVARYSHLDTTDRSIAGGVLDKWHVGVNWWASTQWKLGVSYGYANLDPDGAAGKTNMLLTRVQWIW